LFQVLSSLLAHSPFSTELSEDDGRGRIDVANDRNANVPEVSCLAKTDLTASAPISTVPTLTETEIAALVATHLRRYL
jgi:hypothetical protein